MNQINRAAAALAFACFSGSACAMNSPATKSDGCHVRGAEKLPPEVGGADAICNAIKRAVTATAPDRRYSVEITVHSSASLSAVVKTAAGHALPEQRMAVSDSTLRTSSIERFADSIAASLASATS